MSNIDSTDLGEVREVESPGDRNAVVDSAAASWPAALRDWGQSWIDGWDQFWFTPRHSHTLALIRIATGAMLLYTHLVLASDLLSFLGPDAWINNEVARGLHQGAYGASDGGWSYLWLIDSPTKLWLHQWLAIAVTFCMTIGLATRLTVPLSWFLQLIFVHRLTGSLFGLDQVTTMLVTYLVIAPSGAVFSLDAVLRRKLAVKHGDQLPAVWRFWLPAAVPSVAANVATRLMQLHLCVIYLFGGLWKARGEMWWDGTALWFAAANYEYQSNDLTWLARFPVLFAALTHLTIFWETFYCALVWPRITRPLVLAMAVMVHGGIAIFLGMITFGVMMIVANAAFIAPESWGRLAKTLGKKRLRVETGGEIV